MNAQHPLFTRLATLDHLPTLPHILLKLIEACNQDNQDLNGIADILSKDPVLSAKILKLVNSAYFGLFRKVEAVSEAVVLVGTSGIKSLAICACVVDTVPVPQGKWLFSLKAFWWHSLRCAFLAKHMAAEWEACPPDDAFLAGLLHDIGKVVLWANFRKSYEAMLETSGQHRDRLLAGEAHMGGTHAEVGAWLLGRWQLDPSIADCVRYHHEQPDRISQAFAMVQIVHVANLLGQDAELDIHAGLAMASSALGRDSDECRTLMTRSDQEAREVAHSLDIDVDAHGAAADRRDGNDQAAQARFMDQVRNHSLLVGTLEGFIGAEDKGQILKCIADGLHILFDIRRTLFFLIDEKKHALVGYIPDKSGRYVNHHALAVSTTMSRSLLVRALVEGRSLDSPSEAASSPLTIIDEQLNRLLGGDGMICLPLVAQTDPVGVVAIGVDNDNLACLQSNANLLHVFTNNAALALRLDALRHRQRQALQATRMEASSDLARRVVHEVNNPLSIIKNYLKVLSMKMAAAGMNHDEISIISEEITRVGRLLGRLSAFSTNNIRDKQNADVNAILSDTLRLIDASLLGQANIRVNADLAPHLPILVTDPDGLRQVLVNLIKNAAEAMADAGGTLEVRTRHHPPAITGKARHAGKDADGHVEIVIRDDGPGIAEAIKDKLFDPYVSTKSGFHSGLGLSVVHNTVTSLHGTIVCESLPNQGTTFTIELPVSHKG